MTAQGGCARDLCGARGAVTATYATRSPLRSRAVSTKRLGGHFGHLCHLCHHTPAPRRAVPLYDRAWAAISRLRSTPMASDSVAHGGRSARR